MSKLVGPPGVLMVFEGIDGAGKSTQLARLGASLSGEGFEVVCTREPTDGPWGRLLRSSATTGRLQPEDELSAFVRDREDHVRDTLRPSLDEGRVVLIDRYYFSNAAYQGVHGMDPEDIIARNEAFAPIPDLLIHLDVPVARGLARVVERGGSNLFEREADLRRASEIFRALRRPYLLRLDGERPADDLAADILAAAHRTIAGRPTGRG